jgi:hypothetical protein
MGCPQGSCCGPGFWNVLYNALLNLEFFSYTKIITFAEDFAILNYGKTLSEATLQKQKIGPGRIKCSSTSPNPRPC